MNMRDRLFLVLVLKLARVMGGKALEAQLLGRLRLDATMTDEQRRQRLKADLAKLQERL